MAKYTESEVLNRVAALTPGRPVLSRRAGNGVDSLEGVKDFTSRTLNSDVDGFFYLTGLHVGTTIRTCVKLADELAQVARMSPAAQRENPEAKDYLPDLVQVLDRIQLASGAERAALVAEFSQLARTYALSCRNSYGDVSVGVPSARAVAAAAEAAARAEVLLKSVVAACDNLAAALYRYSTAAFWSIGPARHALHVRDKLVAHLEDPQVDPSDAVLDSLVAASLISANESVRDVTLAKYTGTVTTNSGLPPKEADGFFLPKALPKSVYGADLVKSITVDGLYGGTVTYPLSESPVLSVPAPSGFFARTEEGSSQRGDGVTAAYTEYLKTTVVPGSVTITTQNVGNAVMTVTDDGVGGWVGDAVAGSIDYLTGVATVTFSANVRAYDAIHWRYQYNLVGDFKQRDATGVLVSSYNNMSVFRHNSLATAALSQAAAITTLIALASEMGAKFAGTPLYAAASGDLLQLSSDLGGAYAQLMFPAYATVPVVNPAFGAPTWSTPPTNVNELLGAVQPAVPRSFGKDTAQSDVVVSAGVSSQVYLNPVSVPKYVNKTYTITAADKNKIAIVGVDGLTAGKSVVEFTSPVQARLGVLSVAGSVITMDGEYPFPVTTGTTLAASVDTAFSVYDQTTELVSRSTHANAAMVVAAGALWTGGTYRGYSDSVTMGSLPSTGYTIRPGDVVLQGDTKIGTVGAVSGKDLTLLLDDDYSFYPDPNTTALVYPHTDLTIRGLGQYMLGGLTRGAYRHATRLEALVGPLAKAVASYAASGAGYKEYATLVAEATAAVASLLVDLQAYSYNRVAVVDQLLSFLDDEKLSGLSGLLRSLQFDYIDVFSAEELSETSAVELELEGVIASLGGNEEHVEYGVGRDPAEDYYDR